MKFKLLSLVLLLVCFVFLGVLADVIPVGDGGTVPVFRADEGAERTSAPTVTPAATPRTAAAPTPRLAGTAAPVSTQIIAGPTPSPAGEAPSPVRTVVSPAGTPDAARTPAPAASALPTDEAPATDTPAPATPTAAPTSVTPTAAPTATPAPVTPTAAPAATPTAAPVTGGWEPDAELVSTTITWSDPLQNDTDISLDGAPLLDQPPDITLPASGAQILILHTHGTEAYTPDGDDQYEATADWRTIDTDHTVIRVGQALADALERYGLRVIVDTELYDWPSYNGSYSRAEQAIERYLEQNPGIAMIIDLHRDALGDDEVVYKTVSDELDAPAAQMMFVVGTDENLTHPNWRENLALAVSLQGLVEEKYPHLMRPTLVCPYRYNQQFSTGSVLLEIGTAGNTLQEAITSAELFADAVGPVLAARVAA